MSLFKNISVLVSVVFSVLLFASPVYAEVIATDAILAQEQRSQLVNMLEREDVQKQLVEMGVDPVAALSRVEQMSNEEVAQLNGQIEAMPVGAGLSTMEWLLIIIIIILLV